MNQTTKRSSSGSARLGRASGFPFARGPLLAPEDAGGAAGGSGGDGTTTTTTTASTTTGEPGTAPGGEKLLPQSQVNTLIATNKRDAYEKGKADALKELEAKQAGTAQPKKTDAPKSADDRIAELEAKVTETQQRGAFEKHAAKLGIPDDLAEDLFEAPKSQRPENVGTWLASKAERFGIKPAPAASTASATTSTAAATTAADPAKPAPAAPGAPSAHTLPTANGVVDLFNLTPAQLQGLGPQGVRENLEKLWKIGNQMSGAPQRPKPPSQR